MSAAAASVNDLDAVLGAKKEMDALTLIAWIRKILAQPHDERNLDAYVELIRQLCKARNAVLALVEGEAVAIRAVAQVSTPWGLPLGTGGEDGTIARARRGGFAHEMVRDGDNKEALLVLVRVHGQDDLFLALELSPFDRSRVNEIVIRCMLVTDLSERTAGGVAEQSDAQLHDMLDLVADVVHHADFVAASLALVNGLASRFDLAFAALVRTHDGHATLGALSHVDKFDRSSEFVERVENAALEVLKHDRLVSWSDFATPVPPTAGSGDQLAVATAMNRMTAVPLHDDAGETTFVMLMSSNREPLSTDALDRIQFGLDIVEPRLLDLHGRSLSAFARAKERARVRLTSLLGPEHLWLKTGALVFSILLVCSLVFKLPYRVDAATELTTDSSRVISAQFDGHVDKVFVTVGDDVVPGQPMATLDTRELVEQRMEDVNDLARFDAEVSKAQAAGALADAQINQARADEAKARIDQIDYMVGQANCVAPFKGVVIEGERRDLLNAPVKRGERIFKIAKVEGLYLMLAVSERDIRDVAVGATGDVLLLSRPDQPIKFHVVTINPVGQVKGQEGNQFLVKAAVDQAPEAWWRPGMTGVAKVDAGKRQVFWMLTHRLVDFIRMKFLF